jgi:hypothetical protein
LDTFPLKRGLSHFDDEPFPLWRLRAERRELAGDRPFAVGEDQDQPVVGVEELVDAAEGRPLTLTDMATLAKASFWSKTSKSGFVQVYCG